METISKTFSLGSGFVGLIMEVGSMGHPLFSFVSFSHCYQWHYWYLLAVFLRTFLRGRAFLISLNSKMDRKLIIMCDLTLIY